MVLNDDIILFCRRGEFLFDIRIVYLAVNMKHYCVNIVVICKMTILLTKCIFCHTDK